MQDPVVNFSPRRLLLVGLGEIVRTSPMAGTQVFPGDTIRLRYRGQQDD